MPVSLCAWRVRIGRFVQWIKEYEVRERKEKLLREKTRLLKVLTDRLLAKMTASESDDNECDGKENDGSKDNESILKENRTTAESTTKQDNTMTESTIKENNIQTESTITDNNTPTEATKENNAATESTSKESNTATESTIIENNTPTESTSKENNTPTESTTKENNSATEYTITGNNTPTEFTTKENNTATESTITKSKTTTESTTKENNTPAASPTKENNTATECTTKENNTATTTEFTTKENNTETESTIKENNTQTESTTNENNAPTKHTTKESNTTTESTFKENNTQTESTTKESNTTTESTITKSKTTSEYTKKEINSTIEYTTITENNTQTEPTTKKNNTETESTTKENSTPTTSTITENNTTNEFTTKQNNTAHEQITKENTTQTTFTLKDNYTSTEYTLKTNNTSTESTINEINTKIESTSKQNNTTTVSPTIEDNTPKELSIKQNNTSTESTIKENSTKSVPSIKENTTPREGLTTENSTTSAAIVRKMNTAVCINPCDREIEKINTTSPEQLFLQAGDVETNPGPPGRSIGVLQERELLKLADDVSPEYYYTLCIGLGFTHVMGKQILTQNLLDVSPSVLDMLCKWKVKQMDGTDCRHVLVEILRGENLNELASNVSKGTYYQHENTSNATLGDGTQPLTNEEVTRCREDFKHVYRTQLCMIKTDPLDFETIMEFERIYTDLVLLKSDKGTTEKLPLEYNALLTTKINGTFPRRLMLEGEGGAGKTTFCSKIAWDWTNKRDVFKEFNWVVVIPLRDSEQYQTVGDIAKTYLSDSNPVQPCQIDKYISDNPSKVFIIFDGLDEYKGDLFDRNSDISKIMRSEKFKECRVLITTRPWRAYQIKSNETFMKTYAFIAVTGFNKEQISTYITQYFRDDENTGKELIKFIADNDVIQENMAPFPLYIAMLCILWRDSDTKKRQIIRRLKTFSQLFKEIIIFLKDHYISKQFVNPEKKTMAETSKDLDIFLSKIGEIALSGVFNKKLVYSKRDFSSCEEAMDVCCRIGVLTQETRLIRRRDRHENVNNPMTSSVFFSHKLFQEYLAGMYLAFLYESNHDEYERAAGDIIRKGVEEFRYLLYFTASQKKNVGLNITNMLKEHIPHNINMLVDVTFETHDEDAAKLVGQHIFAQQTSLRIGDEMSAHTVSGYFFIMEKEEVETLVLSRRSCGPTVSRDLADVICSSKTLTALELFGTGLHDDFYSILEGNSKASKVERLSIAWMDISDEQKSRNLAKFLNMLPSLKDLTLTGNKFHAGFCSEIASGTVSKEVERLSIGEMDMPDEQKSRNFAKFLNMLPSMKDLTLTESKFHAGFYLELTSGTVSKEVERLSIAWMDISDEQKSCYLAKFLNMLPSLKDLRLTGNKFHAGFYSELASGTVSKEVQKLCNSVRELNIDHRNHNEMQQYHFTVESLFPNLEQLFFTTRQTVSPDVIRSLAHSGLKELSFASADDEDDDEDEDDLYDDDKEDEDDLSEDEEYHVSLIGDPTSLEHVLLNSFPRLTKLTLNGLVIGNNRCHIILQSLEQRQKFKEICVIHCYTDEELDHTASAINMENRMNVNLQHDKTQKRMKCHQMSSALVDALCHRTSIQELVLYHTTFNKSLFSEESGRTIDSKIEKLNIISCNLERNDPTASRDLARFLCILPCLTNLTIQDHDRCLWLHDDFYHEIARPEYSSKIEKLNIAECNLERNDPTASSDLARFLCFMPCLTDLTIHCSRIHDEFYHEIARLASSSKIQTMCIDDCRLGNNDPTASRDLARFVCLLPCLIDLTIKDSSGYIQLHDDFYHEICRLSSSSKIQTICIDGCRLDINDPTASRDLARFVCLLPCLTDLTIKDSQCLRLHDDFYHEICRLSSSSKIEKLHIGSLNLKRNNPTSSQHLAKFLCLLPCLNDLTIQGSYHDFLHDDFYHEICRLSSSSKVILNI